MEHGFKCITFYVQKHVAPLAMCYKPMLVHDKLLGAPAFVKLIYYNVVFGLSHWGRVTHIFVSKLITIGSNNGLSPGEH